MNMPLQHDFELIAGDSLVIPLTFIDPEDDDQSVDVRGWSVWLTLKQSKFDEDEKAVLQKTEVLPESASNGEFDLTLTPEDTHGLKAIVYDYDLQLVSPDKKNVVTTLAGRFRIEQGTTEGY